MATGNLRKYMRNQLIVADLKCCYEIINMFSNANNVALLTPHFLDGVFLCIHFQIALYREAFP